MSIASSFYSALSGMNTQATAMQVIGDNIANLNTTGFKGSSVYFEDVLGQSLSTIAGTDRSGVGSKVSSVDGNFIQGTLETTNVDTDLAVNGRGFFVVEEQSSLEKFYTRSGHFFMNEDGYYVNSEGLRVQGYLYDSTGTNMVETLGDIQVDQASMVPPRVTSAVQMVLNLDPTETATTWNIADPGGTAHYSTAVQVYDTLGQSHNIQVYFTKTGTQAWSWNATIDGSDVSGGTPGTPVLYGTGTLGFDASGVLTTAMPENFYTGTVTYANGIAASASTVDFTDTSQYGSPSAVLSLTQDGYAAGMISGITINEEGTIVGSYTNGAVKNIAQLVLAQFPNLNGLNRKGAMLYEASTTSGEPLYNKPGNGGMGNISAGMLEESNIDLAAEFIKMIITQRGYQANSKVISTTDEMFAQLLSIK
jgi:flagellar hook protein FlgE